jgi:hypothetical protein
MANHRADELQRAARVIARAAAELGVGDTVRVDEALQGLSRAA